VSELSEHRATPAATTTVRSATTATQAALAAEYAAVYGYGVVGAHTSGAARAQASRALAWHQARQPVLAAALTSAGAKLPTSAPAYVLPFAVTDAADAARLATALEQGVAATYADLVAATESGERQAAALALSDCAVRAAQWRGFSVPFPGLPERATSA
jgi:hypothetical protein